MLIFDAVLLTLFPEMGVVDSSGVVGESGEADVFDEDGNEDASGGPGRSTEAEDSVTGMGIGTGTGTGSPHPVD